MEQSLSIGQKLNKVEWYSVGNYAFTRTTPLEEDGQTSLNKDKQLVYVPIHNFTW